MQQPELLFKKVSVKNFERLARNSSAGVSFLKNKTKREKNSSTGVFP